MVEYERKIDMLASSTTCFNKDFGSLRREASQFYRQLRDAESGSLMLLPSHIKTRGSKEKFIRDQIAFNLVVLAATQV